jgi:hypothetical protein
LKPFVQQPVHQRDNAQGRQADQEKDHQQAPEHPGEEIGRHPEDINDQGRGNKKAQQKNDEQPAAHGLPVKKGLVFPGWLALPDRLTFLPALSHLLMIARVLYWQHEIIKKIGLTGLALLAGLPGASV